MITATLCTIVTNGHYFTNLSSCFIITVVDLMDIQMKYIMNEVISADRLSILRYHLLPNSL
jgi:ribonucleotide reductase alpha subunit